MLKACLFAQPVFAQSVIFYSAAIFFYSAAVLADDYTQQRQQMIADIDAYVETTVKVINKKTIDENIMQVMAAIPRHEFVPQDLRARAYDNEPLPIGYGQTISQPYIVALMTQLLQPQSDQRVLEIGTGSGYQAAVLSELVARVYSIEIVEELGKSSAKLLARLGFDNVETRIADGYNGWPEQAPFDSILVTAAISHIPPPLVQQLKKGGRMLIPVGTRFQTQYLTLVEKDLQGAITTRQVLPVYFVPFTGGH
jgi:protein-L-isoaspartate(D-aspartate) O-methyltransferase